MRIKIQDLQNRDFEIECNKEIMGEELIKLVSERVKIASDKFVLVSKESGISVGMEEINRTLKQIGIRDGEVLNIVPRTSLG